MSYNYRAENCVFCPNPTINNRCGILERTLCTDSKRFECSFYKTEKDFKQAQVHASRILNSKGLSVKIENNIVRAIKRKV